MLKIKVYLKLFIISNLILMLYILSSSEILGAVINKSYVDITVPSAIVIDADSGRVLYEKNADEKRKIASLTKVMTSIMLVENCNMKELINIPKDATWIGGSTVGLKAGDKVSARSLLYGMLLPSRK